MFSKSPVRSSNLSPSSRRAWIEICRCRIAFWLRTVALLAEGVDRNLRKALVFLPCQVALLAEGVDRNRKKAKATEIEVEVALLAEGVDRNLTRCACFQRFQQVALLAEGVDRNFAALSLLDAPTGRPPRGGRG